MANSNSISRVAISLGFMRVKVEKMCLKKSCYAEGLEALLWFVCNVSSLLVNSTAAAEAFFFRRLFVLGAQEGFAVLS